MATTLDEKFDKIKSPNLQSQKQTAIVLQAVEASLKEQQTPTTPTAYFSALLALLNKSVSTGSVKSDATTTSVVYLLDVVTPHAPPALLQAKFTPIVTLLAPVLLLAEAEAALLKPTIGCLESLLRAQDSAAWQLSAAVVSPRRAVAGLLALALDHRPKVRKRAQDALHNVLRNPPPSPAIDHPAADMCAETAMRSLTDLAAARGVAVGGGADGARQSHKKQGAAAATGANSNHDPELMHALQLVRAVAAATAGWPSKKMESLVELLLGTARSGGVHMTAAVFDVFELIFAGMAQSGNDAIAAAKLPRLLATIADELRPAPTDAQLLPPWMAILSRGYDVAAQLEPEETFAKLPELFDMMVQYLEPPAPANVRVSAAECLISFVANCVPRQVILEPSVYDEMVLEKVAKTAQALLTVRYQTAWVESFRVLGAMFDALRWRAFPALLPVVKLVGDIRGSNAFEGKEQADEVLGKAIRAMGPEAVLGVLPLNLARPAKGELGRVWMLLLLRDYTNNTNLAHFRAEFVPLSQLMFQRVLDNGDADKSMEIKIYETVVQQIWSILPGYCDLPLDLTTAFDQSFAELLANLLYEQTNLRLDICRALKVLVESNEAIASVEEEDGEEDLVLQSRVSKAQAHENLNHLRQLAGGILVVLFNVYSQTLPQSRGPLLQTINAYLGITPEKELVDSFDRVSELLIAELQAPADGAARNKPATPADQLPPTSHSLMDLIITMSIHLPRKCFSTLFKLVHFAIGKDVVGKDDPQLQKKAYKLIPRLADSAVGKMALQERSAELLDFLVAHADKVSIPARRERLAAIASMVPLLNDSSLHFIPSVLSEVVVACKEHNERARAAAYDLLVTMGERMDAAKGKPMDNSKIPGLAESAAGQTTTAASLDEFFTMVSTGLAVESPHVVSASVAALARILHEFHARLEPATVTGLVETMDLFLTSRNREVVKSVLGFVKVCVIDLPPKDVILPRLPTLMPNLTSWGKEHKGHFKTKVKHILERMVRRLGFDAVNRACPEQDRKLLANIRKTRERNKRKKADAKSRGEDYEGDDSDSDDGGADAADGPRRRFESEYDEALYSSDDSDGEGKDDGGGEQGHHSRGGRKANNGRKPNGAAAGGDAFILEDDDEPLDLLGRSALARVSSTRPSKQPQPPKSRRKADVDLDGKLILGDGAATRRGTAARAAAQGSGGDAMDVDGADNVPVSASGVGAYVAAITGKDVAKRGQRGKLKFSNRRQKDGEDDEDEDEPAAAAGGKKQRQQQYPGGSGAFKRPGQFGAGGRGGSSAFRGAARGITKPGTRGNFGGGRSGKGHIASGRRGLGEEKRRGPAVGAGGARVGKSRGGRGRR